MCLCGTGLRLQSINGDRRGKSVDEAITAFEKTLSRVLEAKNKVGESEAVQLVDAIMAEALIADASDVHIEPMQSQLRIRFRSDGVMIPHKVVEKQLSDSVISRFKILASADITEKRRHQEGRIVFEDPRTGHNVDLRASFYVTIYGEKLFLRVLSTRSRC